ncbi:PREDICTED: uncharacterized protein LOC107352495 [Paramuricea clavata]|uniref:PREDICTED: uncharacterized protein LOC107352495 n=1 Tax=Paramuricea clavata TaxID=317549 RepID=A0A7D9DL81_PARCT|nr:PREDICTED: uncharacterized protein LOC107352495 [Paramuricea clavata]
MWKSVYIFESQRQPRKERTYPNFQPPEEALEKDMHSDLKEPVSVSDDRYNYATLRLSMRLFLRNFDDSVKEGDGERTIRCWKFAMLLFRLHGHNKYALAALQLQAWLQAMLNPKLSHSLMWNRYVNNKGGPGKNIALALRLEHLTNLLKGLLKHLGPNVTESAAQRCSQSIHNVEKLLESVDSDLNVKRSSCHHKVKKSHDDLVSIVKEL